MTLLIGRAATFALAAHTACGQVRKYTGEPYFQHPHRVASTLQRCGFTQHIVAAGYLHDVVEDTGVSIDLIKDHFGPQVAELVNGVTCLDYAGEGLLRAEKFERNLTLLLKQPRGVWAVRLADIHDNLSSMIGPDGELYDPEFAKVWVPEKRKTFEHIKGVFPILDVKVAAGLELVEAKIELLK